MTRWHRIHATGWLLACFLVWGAAFGESGLLDRVGSVFDNIGHGLSAVGRKAGDIVGPGLGLGEKDGSNFIYTRQFDERYPAGPASLVGITNEFGEIRVETWPNQVVQVAAEISVGADTRDAAKKIAEAIDISVTATKDRLDVRTRFPDSRPENGNVSMTVNYVLTLPVDAGVTVENYFGDTFVTGVGGTVGIQAEYGVVGVRDIAGPVQVRARGPFTVEARGLRQGGAFELNGSHAVLEGIAGTLKVSNFSGPVEIRNPAPDAQLDVTNESGPVTLHLAQGAAPDLAATCLFGEITSDIELSRSVQGQLTVGRTSNIESGQHIALRTSFGNIEITQEGVTAAPAPSLIQDTMPFKDTTANALTVAEGVEVAVEAMPGEVTIEGVDQNELRVDATRYVRVRNEGNAQAALEAMVVNVQPEEGRVRVATRVVGDMAALGCLSYRVDLAILCPRTCPVVVQAQEGHSAVRGTGGAIRIEQASGAVTIEHAKGPLTLTNGKGGVMARQCAGPVQVTASYGDIELNEIYGAVTATGEQSKVVLEALATGATVRNRGGDVRVIALNGVQGDYDILAEQGNVSFLLPPDDNATFEVIAENGVVYSKIPLNGSIGPGAQEFHGRVGEGAHRLTLHTKGGDIRIN